MFRSVGGIPLRSLGQPLRLQRAVEREADLVNRGHAFRLVYLMEREKDFEEFCRSEYPAVFRAAVGFSGSHEIALDATQEAFAKAFARWRRLGRHAWAGGWVMTTALNHCKRSLRRARPHEASSPVATPDSDLRLDVIDALRELPTRQREAVLLHYLADLPVAVVADLMRTTEGTVKTHLSRARRALKTTLDATAIGGPR